MSHQYLKVENNLILLNKVDQQPPILHPQQQPTNTQRYRYTYHQPQQQQGQQQVKRKNRRKF